MDNLLRMIYIIIKRRDNINNQISKLKTKQQEYDDLSDSDDIYSDLYDSDDDFDDYGDLLDTNNDNNVVTSKKNKPKKELTRNIPIDVMRQRIKSKWIESDEQLYPIDPTGNCFYASIAELRYHDEKKAWFVREEIVKYMLETSFGSKYVEKYKKYYNDFKNGHNIPELLQNGDIINIWKQGIYSFYDGVAPLNHKIAYAIAETMEGIDEKDEKGNKIYPSWADMTVIPMFTSMKYNVILHIYYIGNDNNDPDDEPYIIDYTDTHQTNETKQIYKLIFYDRTPNNHYDAIGKKK